MPKKKTKREIETFTDEEIKLMFSNLPNNKLRIILIFALTTGLRAGEIYALTVDDIKDSVVTVNKSVKSVKVFKDENNSKFKMVAETPKTSTSIREVPLPSKLIDELKKLSIIRKEERLKAGSSYHDNNLLFPSELGTYIDHKNLTRQYKRELEKLGIQYKKFHALRHTYATKLFENGTSILTVSKLLGKINFKKKAAMIV